MLRQLGEFITKRPLVIVAIWAIILIVSLPLALNLDGRLQYDITSFIPKDMASYQEKTLYQSQFSNEPSTQVVVAVESDNGTSAMYFIDDLNRTVAGDALLKNVTSTTSIYEIQRQALVDMTPELHSTLYDLYDNATKADNDLYSAVDAVKNTSGQLYDLRNSVLSASVQLQGSYALVVKTSQQLYAGRDQVSAARDGLRQIRGAGDIIYGLPLAYAGTLAQANASGADFTVSKAAATQAVDNNVNGITDPTFQALAAQYTGAFESAFDARWQASYASDPAGTLSGWQAMTQGIIADPAFKAGLMPLLPSQYSSMFGALLNLGVSGYQDRSQGGALQTTVVQIAMASQPAGTAAQQAQEQTLLNALYPTLGMSSDAANGVIDQLTLQAATQALPDSDAQAARDVYNMGRNPSHDAVANYVLSKACEGRNDSEQQVIRDVWDMGEITTDVADSYVLQKACEGQDQSEIGQIKDIYAMGQSPNDSAVDAYVLRQATVGMNQTEADFVGGVFGLGRNASDASIRAYVCGKVAGDLNVTGNASYVSAVMALDRNASVETLDEFAHDWAYSHDYSDPQIFSDEIVKNLASGNMTLYAVTLGDDEVSESAHDAVTGLRKDVQDVSGTGRYPGVSAYVTGESAFGLDTQNSATTDVSNIDKISVVLIIFILGVYFVSILTPFVPLAVIGAAILTGFGALYLASYDVSLYYLTKTFMIVVMLGAGTDYCVFILSRYAEERGRGREVKASVIAALEHAGRSVLGSGTTAMIGFASLMLIDRGIFNSMGQSMALAILISMLIALTLMPAVLTLAGDRLFWPRKIYNTKKRATRTGQVMRRITHGVIRHWKLVLVATVLLAVPAVWLYAQMAQGSDIISMMPNNIESKIGYDMMNAEFGSGNIDKTQIIVTLPESLKDSSGNYTASALGRVERISGIVASVSGVDKVYSATRPEGEAIDYDSLSSYGQIDQSYYRQNMDNRTGSDGRTTTIDVAFVGSPYSEESDRAIDAIRQKLNDYSAGEGNGTVIMVGGTAAMNYDYQQTCSSKFGIVVAVVFAGIFIVFLALLRSIWTPVRLFLSLLMGIVWTLAAFTVVFQYWLNVPIIWILPIVLFCTLMGLGGDYVVFMMSRVREEVDRGESDEKAIEHAVEATGPVILLCGLVMASAFGSMMISNMAELREFGFVLSLAIMLDATLMVLVLIPSVMMLLKKLNWWMPGAKKKEAMAGVKAAGEEKKV